MKSNKKNNNEEIKSSISLKKHNEVKPLVITPENNNKYKYKPEENIKKNQNINLELESLLKSTNNNTLKKYNNTLDQKIKYLKFMNNQLQNNNINDNSNIQNNISENDKSKTNQGESTFDNSENPNYIHTKFPNSIPKLTKRKSEIIKKIIPNNIYYKHRGKNMCFKLDKKSDKIVKETLETNHSKEDINLNYEKFRNSFLIINDSISISTNTKIKNTNSSFFKFISFLNNSEILKLFSVNREIRSCLIGCLVYKVKEKILPDFNIKYCNDILFNKDYNFMISTKVYKKKQLHIRFILSIKPKITKINTNIINKRIKIGFLEYIQNKFIKKKIIKNKHNIKDKIKVNTLYIFEVIEKLNPKHFWIFRENTSFHFDENNKAYYNDVIQFWPGDKPLININLISEMGIIDFDNFCWIEPKFIEIKNKDEKNNVCEVEQMINEWNKIIQLENCDIVKKNINDLFGQNFIIQEISYEDVGYYFFKIILKAYKIGICCGREGNLGIKINILPINSNITNEIKKNGLIFDENNELMINVGDIITFYISQNKN